MKIADIVKNSIWYDPRVRKQILIYLKHGYNVAGVGVFDDRYDDKEILKLGCLNFFAKKQKNGKYIFSKILREARTNKDIYKYIIKFNPDAIHANDLNALIPAYRAYRKLKRNKRVILIYDSHEIFLENPWIVKRRIIKFIWSIFENYIIHKVDIFVCVSNSAKYYFQNKYHLKDILVITNSVMKQSILHSKNMDKTIDILNQGQFYAGRGYDTLLDAAAMSKKDSYTFTLRGYGSLEPQLRQKTAELKLNNVCFANPVKTSELINSASKSSIGIAITNKISKNFIYSVSNKIFEYAAAGLPVIMSDIPEHNYLNDKYHFGVIIKHDDAESILKAIEYITKSNKQYNYFSKNSIKMARETSFEKEFDKLIKEIEK